ncbi:MAG: AAA family ATPase [Candidatus Paceibacterota bacterium]
MHLQQLTISGFKSFAKKGELEFSSSITAIVGPNGSGKSNVAEAFRFVLGEQSPTRMRGKKGEDLIWGGTDHVSRANRASVTLLLNNEKRIFPIDFDQIALERTVHRDGQNEYSINGSKVRLKDVQELLAAANIGSTGHHIISQGEADRILVANPKERREMIEDALGLKLYQYKKAEAEKKLKKTKENIEKVESLRREVAPHLNFLERQIKKIERAVALREELKSAYTEYLRREDTYLAHQHDRLEKMRNEPSKKLENLVQKLTAAKQKLQEAEKDEKRDALVSVESALRAVRSEHQSLLHATGRIEGEIQFLKKRIAAAKEKSLENTRAPIPYADVQSLVHTIERSVEKSVQEDNTQLLHRMLHDVVHTLKTFLTRVGDQGVSDTESEEAELKKLENGKNTQEIALNTIAQKEEELQKKYDAVRLEIEAEASESREAEREVFRIVSEQRENETKIEKIDHEQIGITRDRDEFKRELQEAVALIGRSATDYLQAKVTKDGKELSVADIVSEDREAQQERRRALEKKKIRFEELGGANSDIEKEYAEVKERDDFLVREISDLTTSVTKLEELITELNEELDRLFVAGIEKIGREFNRFFTLMFGGGEAKLLRVKPKIRTVKMVDDLDGTDTETLLTEEDEHEETVEGIELDVKLPNKRVRGLEMLSGGERALTSIALIFAMSQVNPPLFVILDETDAALDEANSRRYGDMIVALSERSQLILITHNRETMRRAGILYGITMGADGVSKLLSVKFEDAVAVSK